MKAAVLYEPKTPLVIEEVDLSEPAAGEVMVKVEACGVCHSDWHVVKGDWPQIALPTILGHEVAGVVEAVGPQVSGLERGDHVMLTWKAGCGRCDMCQQGWPAVCDLMPTIRTSPTLRDSGVSLNRLAGLGGFGAYTVVPANAAVPVDRDIPFPQAATVGCAVTTGVGAVFNTAGVRPGTTVAVFGCGGVGLNCVQGARIAGATTIIAVDLLENKLELARELGATHVITASREDPVPRIIDRALRLRGHRSIGGSVRAERRVHAETGRHGVGRRRAGGHDGDPERAGSVLRAHHYRLLLRQRQASYRLPAAADHVQGRHVEARRAHIPDVPSRRGQLGLRGAGHFR